ncbi:MAG: PAS-domain containing protein, partial [Alphaproteobacteria bacterium]|nr:PAS-domain containing protein [Alphaproteobacteria bacterium]
MTPLFLRTVRARMLLAAICVLAVMLALMVGNGLRVLGESLSAQTLVHAHQLTSVLHSSLVAPLAQLDYASVQAIVDESRSAEVLDYIVVLDSNGQMIANSGWTWGKALPDSDATLSLDDKNGMFRHDVRSTVRIGGQVLGDVQFGLNLTRIVSARDAQFFQSVTIAIAGIILSAALMAGISIWLTRHLSRLTRLSEEVAKGNFTPAAAPEGDDDVGQLGAAFNTMSRAVRDRIDELTVAMRQREKAENELRASEHRFRELAGSASDWFWETDAGYRLTFVSERINSVLGVNASAIIGFSWFEIGLDDYPEVAARHRADLAKREPFRDLAFTVGLRGARDFRTIRISGLPVFNEHGFCGYRGVGVDITREVAAEQSAALARQQLVDAIESLVDAIAVFDAQDRLVICNRGYVASFEDAGDAVVPGATFEAILRAAHEKNVLLPSWTDFDLWLSDRLDRHRHAKGEPFIVRRAGGRWQQNRESPTREGGVVAVSTDITELKEREAELDALRRRYALILDSVNEGIIGLDREGKITFVNHTAGVVLDLNIEDMVGEPILPLIQPSRARRLHDHGANSPILVACRDGIPSESGADTFHRGDGKELPVDYVVTPLREKDRGAGAVLVFRDATLRLQYEWALANQQHELSRQVAERTAELQREVDARARFEMELRTSRSRLRAITDSLVEGVLLVDRHGRLAFANPSASHLLRSPQSVEDMEGMPLDAFMRLRTDAVAVAFADSPWVQVLEQGIPVRSDDAVFELPGGQSLAVAYGCVPLASEDQDRFIVVSFRDVGALKQAQWEMMQSSRLASVGQLAAGIAHEINTPTQYIGDNLGYISDGVARLRRAIEAARELADAADPFPTLAPVLLRYRETVKSAKLERILDELPAALTESLDGVIRISRIVLSMKEFSHPGTTVKTTTDINRALENTLTVSRNAWKH